MEFDIAIIGGGAAGVSAVINAKILQKKFIWFASGELSKKLSQVLVHFCQFFRQIFYLFVGNTFIAVFNRLFNNHFCAFGGDNRSHAGNTSSGASHTLYHITVQFARLCKR